MGISLDENRGASTNRNSLMKLGTFLQEVRERFVVSISFRTSFVFKETRCILMIWFRGVAVKRDLFGGLKPVETADLELP
jgi:hypothetical protein